MNDVLRIQEIFKNRKPESIKKLREVSVVIALINIDDKLHLIFENAQTVSINLVISHL